MNTTTDEPDALAKAFWLEEALTFADQAQGSADEPATSFFRILAEAVRQRRGPEREIDHVPLQWLVPSERAHLMQGIGQHFHGLDLEFPPEARGMAVIRDRESGCVLSAFSASCTPVDLWAACQALEPDDA